MSVDSERLSTALAGRYRLERELGQGGMATVYLAQDLRHDRQVAIKVLRPELAAVLGADRFVQEIKTTAQLQHPHILPLFDSGQADGFLFYVMPYIQGETLRNKLDREKQLGIEAAVRITTEVADALDYAHRHGVIHRDIKPENVLLHDGRPMVADFGIALALSAAAGGRMTETGLSLGTPHYMSPEQATAEKEITARSDVYSLASVLYEMLTGNPPHTGATAQQIIMKIIAEPVAPVTSLRKRVPPNVAAALAKALEKLPADRFDSARTFSAALTDPAFSSSTTPIGPSRTSLRGREWLPWTVAALALIAAGILALRLGRSRLAPDAGPPWVVDLNLPEDAAFRNGLALSADGSNLVYAGRQQLWRRAAGSVDPVPIPGTEDGCCPAISPDGQQVAFIRGRDVHVIPIQGGTGKLLGTGFAYGDELAWTTDGYVVGAAHERGGLIRIRSTGGPVERFTTIDTAAGEVEHYSPRALPEGNGVVFTILPRDWQQSVVGLRIGVVGPAGGAHTVLLPGRVAAFSYPGYLLVTRADGTVVAAPFDLATRRVTGEPEPVLTVPAVRGVLGWAGYIVVANSGTVVYVGGSDELGRELVWVTRAGQSAPVDFEASSLRRQVSLSGDGRMVAFSAVGASEPPRVEIRDRRTGANSRIGEAGEWVSDPAITADGRAVLYRVIAPGRGGIYRAEFGRLGDATRLLPDSGASGPQLSPDGRTLYFLRDGADLVARQLGAEGGAEAVLLRRNISSRVSPDSRWLAFVDTAGGQSRLFARSTDPNRPERWLVSSSAQGPVRWAPNGREVYFFDHDTLKAAQVAGTTTFVVERTTRLFAASRAGVYDVAVGPDGRFLFLRARPGRTHSPLLRVDDWRRLRPGH